MRLTLRLSWMMVLLSLFSTVALALQIQTNEENPLQVRAQLVPYELSPGQGAELRLQLHLPEGYRAYSDMFKLATPKDSEFHLGQFKIEPLKEFFDETSHKKKMGVINDATLTAPIEAPSNLKDQKSPLVLRLTYQACTKTYCLFPTTIDVPVEFKMAGAVEKPVEKDFSFSELFKKPFSEVLQTSNLFIAFLIIFIAGFLTSLTPCVFPMIPITMAVLGRSAHVRTKWQTFSVAIIYVLGIALTYAALGVFAASTGALFGSFMNSPWVLGTVCVVFLAMALSMFGLYDIEPPVWLNQKLAHAKLEGYSGAFFSGAIAGLVASPCVGPVLVGILTYVAQTKDLWIGFWALFVFAIGMGQLFLIIGIFSSATKLLPKSGAWMDGVKHFFGLLMLFAFYTYLQMLLPARWFDGALGLGAILLGSLMGAFESNLKTAWHKVRKGLCQALILAGAFLLIVSIFDLKQSLNPKVISEQSQNNLHSWETYSTALIEKAKTENKAVVLDFYADWCAACKELEQFTFADPKFLKEAHNYVLLRFDATNDSPELDALRSRFEIMGLPTVLFFNGKGEWQKDLTLTEFEKVDPFMQRLEKLKNR